MKNKITNTRNLNETIIILIIPVIFEMLLETAIGYVDVSMLGRFNTSYLPATAISNSLIFTCLVLANAFSLGGTVLVSKYIGGQNELKRNQVIGQTISLGIIFSIIFCFIFYYFSDNFLKLMGARDTSEAAIFTLAKEYMSVMTFTIPVLMFRQMFVGILRGMGKTKVPMFLSGMNIILNLIFNTIFIFENISIFNITVHTFGLGIKGAAIATLLSRGIALIILIIYFIKIAKFNIKIKDFIFNKEITSGIFSVGVPTAIEMMIFRLGMMYYLSMVNSLGKVSVAAHVVANECESISYMPGSAFNVVIVTLVGQFIGAKKYDLAKECIKKTDKMAILFMGTMGLLFLVVPFLFVRIFTSDPEVINLACKVLRIQALSQVFYARFNVYSGLMRTIGKSTQIFCVTTSSVWCVRILVTYILINFTTFGLIGAWIAMFLDYVYRAVFLTILGKINTRKVFNENKNKQILQLSEHSV